MADCSAICFVQFSSASAHTVFSSVGSSAVMSAEFSSASARAHFSSACIICEDPVPVVDTMYMLFAGGRSGSRPAINYWSFDGSTLTNLNVGGGVDDSSFLASGGARNIQVTSDGNIKITIGSGKIASIYYGDNTFWEVKDRKYDDDLLSADSGGTFAQDTKVIGPAWESGVPIYSTSSVGVDIDHYRGSANPDGGAYDGTETASWLVEYGDYIVALDPAYNAVPQEDTKVYQMYGWTWDGSDLTLVSPNTSLRSSVSAPLRTATVTRSQRVHTDGTYIYFSQLNDWDVIWAGDPKGTDAGIQVMTFDGANFTHLSQSVANQVPNHLGEANFSGVRDMAVGGGYIFVIDVSGESPFQTTLISYTYDGALFTEIDTYDLGDNADDRRLLLEPTNMWLAVDRTGIFDVTGGLFDTLLDATSLTPNLLTSQASVAMDSLLMTTPLPVTEEPDLHSAMAIHRTVQSARFWFDFQGDEPETTYNLLAGSSTQSLLEAVTPANVSSIAAKRTGMFKALQLNGTLMPDTGTNQIGSWFQASGDFSMIFTVGSTGSVTEMPAYNCRTASDQTWSSWFEGTDFKLQFKGATGDLLTFTVTGMGDGALHAIGVHMVAGTGTIQVNVDDAAYVEQTFATDTALDASNILFTFGNLSSSWPAETSNGIFSDLFAAWFGNVLTRAEMDNIVGKVYAEII